MKRQRLFLWSALLSLGAIAYGWMRLFGPTAPASYRQLQIGMPRAAVESLFGEKPDYHCRVGRSEVWYYATARWFTGKFPPDTPAAGAMYSNPAQLPDVYDSIQIAFDEHDTIVAFTWIGETYTVEYRGGSVQGSHLKLVPQDVL